MNECDIETSLQLSLYWEGLWPWVDPSWDWLITVLSCDFDPNWVVTFVRDCMSLIGITPVAWFSRWIDKMWVFSFLTDLKIWQVSWYSRYKFSLGRGFLGHWLLTVGSVTGSEGRTGFQSWIKRLFTMWFQVRHFFLNLDFHRNIITTSYC